MILDLLNYSYVHTTTITTKKLPFFPIRNEDDINDVTSMAGVNLNEENACILATNTELVGTLIQSCKDEPFLFIGALQKRILDIGKCRLTIIDLIRLSVPGEMLSKETAWVGFPGALRLKQGCRNNQDFMGVIERSILF